MGTPTRFPNGLTNSRSTTPMGMFPLPDPSALIMYFNDFFTYAAGDWTVTETSASATQALADGDGGWLVLTNASNDDFLTALQLTKMPFTGATGKKMWFKARAKVSDATQSDFVLGFQGTDTTPLATANGIWFQKDDGAATLKACVANNSTQTTSAQLTPAIADNTFFELGIYYDGKSEVQFWLDGNKIHTAASTNFPNTRALTASFAIQNGAAAAKTLTVDYILAAKER